MICTKRKRVLVGLLLITGSFGMVAYNSERDNYFEISKNLDIFVNLYKQLNIYYVDETNPGELMKTGIDAMLESLDPYTVYIPESDIEDYRFMTTGQYGGIGSLIRRKGDYVVVAEPYEGFPAFKAGLLAGDLILSIDGHDVKGKNTGEISKLLKGQAKTDVNLVIDRYGEKMEKTLTRENIKIKDVPYYGELEKGVGYIKLTSFTETASKEVIKAFKELKEKNKITSLVFDLRGNGGGLLNEAVNIVNIFIPRGTEVVYTKGKMKEWQQSYKALNAPIDTEIPLVVLVDEGSASASEIVSGALQDLDRAVVIGERTFGKGLVQQVKPLTYNSQFKVTVAKYYIPSGRCIQKLDYSNKTDGKATAVADSLRKQFFTTAGRLVKDGKGVLPDVAVELPQAADLTASLLSKNHIFDYASDFKRNNETIDSAKEFVMDENQYNDFIAFLEGKDFDYTTRTEQALERLKKASEGDKYYDRISEEYEKLVEKIKSNKDKDLLLHKKEISQILENEIISRYFYQTGRIEHSLKNDPRVKESISVLNQKQRYKRILAASKK
jgi:carboxyl-terminal processing protease